MLASLSMFVLETGKQNVFKKKYNSCNVQLQIRNTTKP